MTPRMENTLALADKCWTKAYTTNHEFVENYLELAESQLKAKPLVNGDEFREHCANNKLYRPFNLHPNVWVSGVRALKTLGWVFPVQKVEPVKAHNHMPSVTLWRSTIYGDNS